MPQACPTPSTLDCLCIGGQLDPACCDEVGVWPAIRVVAELVGQGSQPVIDPTNCALVVDTKVTIDFEDSDGCWCTCPLKPNKHSLPAGSEEDYDPNLALQPSGTRWKISILTSSTGITGTFNVVAGPFEVELDSGKVYDDPDIDADDCCLIDGPCGTCINLACLIPPPATNPPTNLFCAAVFACLADITGTGLLAGNVTGNYEDGWVIDLTCDDIYPCFGPPTSPNGSIDIGGDHAGGWTFDVVPIVVTSDGDATGITQSGPFGNVIDVVVTSTDANQILTIGADGGTFLDCATVRTCMNIAFVPADGTEVPGPINGGGSPMDPWQIPISPDLVVTTNGSTTGVVQSGVYDHTVDILLLSADADNLLTEGADGGLFLDCAALDDCVESLETPLVATTDGNTTGVTQSGVNDHVVDIVLLSTDADNLLVSGADGGLYLDCAALDDCIEGLETPLVVTTDGNATGVAQSGTNDHIVDILLLGDASTGGDTNNLLETAVNGGLFLSCETIQDCVGAAMQSVDGLGYDDAGDSFFVNIVDENGDPYSTTDGNTVIASACAQIGGITAAGRAILATDKQFVIDANGDCQLVDQATPAAPATVTTDGNATGVTQSATAIDIVVTSTDTGNVLTIGADGGTFLDCAAVNGCVDSACDQIAAIAAGVQAAGDVLLAIDGNGDCKLIPVPSAGSSFTFDDTDCIALTDTAGVITADPILAAANGDCTVNGITCTPDGLWVDPKPVHVQAECDLLGDALDDTALGNICTSAGGGTPTSSTTIRNVGTTSHGTQPNTNGACPDTADDPWTIPFTPTNATDCAVVVTITYDTEGANPDDDIDALFDSNGILGPFTLIDSVKLRERTCGNGNYSAAHLVYTAPVIGTGATDITVDFADGGGNFSSPSIFIMNVDELCGLPNPSSPFVQSATATDNCDPAVCNANSVHSWSATLPAAPTGDVYYASSANHVNPAPTPPNDCVTYVAGSTLDQVTTPDTVLSDGNHGYGCNIGQSTGYVDPANAAQTLTFEYVQFANPNFCEMGAVFLGELNSTIDPGTTSGGELIIADCSLGLTNPNCCDGHLDLHVGTGNVEIGAAPGSGYGVCLRVNGNDEAVFLLDNTNGISPLHQTIPMTLFMADLGGTVAAGMPSAITDIELVVKCLGHTSDPQNFVIVDDFEIHLDLDHI